MANVNIKFNNKDYLLSCDDGQEESLNTDKRYKGLVAAWNFDSNLNEFLEGKPLKFQGQAPAYSPDRNYEPGKALVVNGKTFFSEIYKSLEELGFNWVSHITARQLM